MQARTLTYINRETGLPEREIIYGEAELRFLYETRLGRRLRPWLTGKGFSRVNAIPKRYLASSLGIRAFAETYDVSLEEAEMPLSSYKTLDDFFCRRLKPGLRPVDQDPLTVVAPTDGRARCFRITPELLLPLKSQDVSVIALLASSNDADTLQGGWALIVRLAPRDYHRVHFPVDGMAFAPRTLPGPLESVHPIALNSGAYSFFNKRVVTQIDTTRFGPVFMVEIGALTIGTIVQTYEPCLVKKGMEKSHFRFGGSTVVLLWGASGPTPDDDLLRNSENGIETLIKYGTSVARQRSPMSSPSHEHEKVMS